MSGETLRAPRQQLRRLRAFRLRFILGTINQARHPGAPSFFAADAGRNERQRIVEYNA